MMWSYNGDNKITSHACGCIGPQNGEPLCPCQMRGVFERDGRWIKPEVDLGPVIKKSRILDGDLNGE